MKVSRWLKGLLIVTLSLTSFAFASDVGMINEQESDVAMITDSQQKHTVAQFYNSFVHVDGGRFYRQLVDNSGLFCLDSTLAYGDSCSTAQHWTHGKEGSLWGIGVGFRYNEHFALDFTVWNLDKQKTTSVADSDQNITLDTWLVTALYQAQVELMPQLFVVPQVGIVYLVNTAKGQLNSAAVHTRSINWRPAAGLAILFKVSDRFAADISGVYVTDAGRSPIRAMAYPATTLATAGLRYSF